MNGGAPRFAAVAVIGRPSAGKSTLVNAMAGGKVSIVSPVPQTTRNKVRAIVTRERGQLLLIDTPGLHGSQRKLNLHLRGVVTSSLDEVEMVLYVVDVSRVPGEEERDALALVASFDGPALVALNKIDIEPNHRRTFEAMIGERGLEGFAISALEGRGVDTLLDRMFELAPEGEPAYPEDFYTDQEVEFRISEIIREKAILETRQEVPHALYVEIADIERKGEETGALWVRAFVCVERESQKGILIGRGASRIRKIRLDAESELATLFPYPVELDLRVRVRPRWRRQDTLLRRLIR
jgi:GTP-binding protein Era